MVEIKTKKFIEFVKKTDVEYARKHNLVPKTGDWEKPGRWIKSNKNQKIEENNALLKIKEQLNELKDIKVSIEAFRRSDPTYFKIEIKKLLDSANKKLEELHNFGINNSPAQQTEVAKKLRSQTSYIPKELTGSANSVFFIKIDDTTSGVFKPLKGENPKMRKDIDTYYTREVAAYELAYLIGSDFENYVPTTTLVSKDQYGIGSIQEFIKSEFNYLSVEYLSEEVGKDIALFDAIIGNEDRHSSNGLTKILNRKTYIPVLIDHGLTFPNNTCPEWPRSTTTRRYKDSLLLEKHKKILLDLLKRRGLVEERLFPFIEEKAVEGVFTRIKEMLKSGTYGDSIKWT